MCVYVCVLSHERSLLREHCSSVSTREREKDPDVVLEMEGKGRAGANVIKRELICLSAMAGTHTHQCMYVLIKKKKMQQIKICLAVASRDD